MALRRTFIFLSALFIVACESPTNSEVGSSKDTPIAGMTCVVDTTYLSGSQMYAKGRVTNNGSNTTTTPWYIEAQFYTDATFSTKLGGNNDALTFPLSPGQSTFWTVTFSTTNVDVRLYPNFRVKDVRAIYKN